ncbi:5534_t:CDS:1, partial [Scutellospora calospora]
ELRKEFKKLSTKTPPSSVEKERKELEKELQAIINKYQKAGIATNFEKELNEYNHRTTGEGMHFHHADT